eukprot:scaffold13974_cov115-Isochrysis_galbana.AAC.2
MYAATRRAACHYTPQPQCVPKGMNGTHKTHAHEQKKALLTSGDMAGLLCPPAVRTLPFPSPILSPSRFPCSGRYKRGMASELRALQQPGLEY